MAYEYQERIQRIIWDNEDYWCIDNDKESEELKEVYKKAQAFDNYIADLAKTMEEFPHDYDKYNNFAKETYEFYMKSKEDFIKAYEKEVGRKHELIRDVAEYDRILSDLEDD